MEQININFILKQIVNNKKIAIIGSAGSGKTYLIKQIIEEMNNNDIFGFDENKMLLPKNILNDNIFIDTLYKLIIFDYSYSVYDYSKFSDIKNFICSGIVTFQPFKYLTFNDILKKNGFDYIIKMEKHVLFLC